MTWIDQLKPASFRNVPFHVHTLEMHPGDNVVLREYPFQDLPTVFRMGAAAEEIKFSAYVIGDDYIDQRDALREVLTGDGVLVHPTAGSMRVYVLGKFPVRENLTDEGGMARFDLTFVRADARRFPSCVANTQGTAAAAGAQARVAAKDDFVSRLAALAAAPAWVQERVVDRIGSSVAGVWGKMKGVSGGLGGFTSGLIGSYQVLRDGLLDLVATPRILADQVEQLFALPTDLSRAAGRDFQEAFKWLFTLGSKVEQGDFETLVLPEPGAGLVLYGTGDASALGADAAARMQLGTLVAACDQFFETLALAAYVETTAMLELATEPPVLDGALLVGADAASAQDAPISYDDVMEMRAAVGGQATRLLVGGGSSAAPVALPGSAWHDAVMALHTAGLADLQARSRDLVRLSSFTPPGWMSVWAVSYQLFGTAAYADEIMALNPHVVNPLLVPPGKALRVMRHG